MTPKQLKNNSILELIVALKNKGRCFHSNRKADSILKELEKRLGVDKLKMVSLEMWHMRHGEGCEMFDDECNKLISIIK